MPRVIARNLPRFFRASHPNLRNFRPFLQHPATVRKGLQMRRDLHKLLKIKAFRGFSAGFSARLWI
jgi:hypothetical protein